MAETSKSFVKKFVGFSIVTWVTFALSFLTAPISTRLFAPDVLGKINIFTTYTNLFGIFILIGLDQAFARFYYERPNNRSVGYLFTFCFSITYAIIATFVIVSIPFYDTISALLLQESDNLLLYLLFISIWCTATLRYLNLSYRMEKNIKLYTIQGILMVVASKILYLGVGFWDPSYKPALIASTIAHTSLAAVFLVIQKKRFSFPIEKDKVFANEMFRFALPLVPVSVLTWANTSVPQLVLQNTMDYSSIGIYTSAVALANVILVIQSGFNSFWVPYTYENYKTQTGQFYKVHKHLLCVLTIFALLIVLSQDMIFLLLGEKYRAAKEFFPFLILGPVCYIIGETTGMGIDLSKKTYLNIYVFIISVCVNLIMCLLLRIPLGIPGVAIATAMAAILSMCFKTYFGEKNYKAINSYGYMSFSVIIITVSAVITLMDQNTTSRNLLISILIVVSLFVFRSELKSLYKVALSFIRK